MSGEVQSVILKRSMFPSMREAKDWVHHHHYKVDKIDETKDYYRFRQMPPLPFETRDFRFRNIPLGKVGYLVMVYKNK